jgi:Zn-dependent protease
VNTPSARATSSSNSDPTGRRDVTDALYIALRILLIIPAIILHEVSHGYVANLLGDPTAKNAGRLTLNPLAHVDLWGTILLPGMMLLLSGGSIALGYAKPVPINPNLMTRSGYQNGMLLTGAAGPVTNILLAAVAGLVVRLLVFIGVPDVVVYIFWFFALINLVLAFFNLIPIPPLDGSRVVQRFLKGEALRAYHSMERYGFVIVLFLVFILPDLTHFDWVTPYFNATVFPLLKLFTGIAV